MEIKIPPVFSSQSVSLRCTPNHRHHPPNRFSALSPYEDCSLIQASRTQHIQTRQASLPISEEKGLSTSDRWGICNLEFFKKLVDWPLEGEDDTQEKLADILATYLSALDTHSAQQLSSAYCKEIVMHALIIKNPLLWKTCLELKLDQNLDEKDFYSTLELAITVDNDSFLERIFHGGPSPHRDDLPVYYNLLHTALQHLKPRCLALLLNTLVLNPCRLDQNPEELTLPSLLQRLIHSLIQHRQAHAGLYIDDFQSCIQAVLQCFKGQDAPFVSLPSSLPYALPFSPPPSAPPTTTESPTYTQLLSSPKLKIEDKKVLLALFLDYHLLSPDMCQEDNTLKDIFSAVQDQKRIKHTKRALA